jgi:hypothetical protein
MAITISGDTPNFSAATITTLTSTTGTVTTLNAPSGVLATQNGMTGIAKAWVRFSVSGVTVTVNGSFNISSVTRDATGQYTFALTTAMPNANYSVVPSSGGIDTTVATNVASLLFSISTSPYISLPTTSSFVVAYTAANLTTRYDPQTACVAVFSS